MQLPKWECIWESLSFIPCTLPHLWESISHLTHFRPHGPLHFTFSHEPNVKVATSSSSITFYFLFILLISCAFFLLMLPLMVKIFFIFFTQKYTTRKWKEFGKIWKPCERRLPRVATRRNHVHENPTTLQLNDVLPSHGVKPTWGFHKVKLWKLWLSGTLPASNSKKG